MKIGEVVQSVGLSKKAIRFYEDCGLLMVERSSNGYREYSNENIDTLKQIKLLRLAGVSVSDIKLWRHGVLSLEELLEKRGKEIEKEYGEHSVQCEFCKTMLGQLDGGVIDCTYRLEENEDFIEPLGELSVGIDIGTTTISASVIDHASKRQVESYVLPNALNLPSENGFSEQDADGIINRANRLLDHILDSYKNIGSIGVTGQMHGIVYLDTFGKAVSPLITWEDKRADFKTESGETYCEKIQSITGEEIFTGYGFATHYYQQENKLIPIEAVSFCTVMDYFVMRLTGEISPIVHSTNAASFGFYDVKKGCFKEERLSMLFSDEVKLPPVTDSFDIVGKYKGIPVSVAIGDNQAGFLGTVRDLENSVLVNIGTGSQISMLSGKEYQGNGLELRPFVSGKYLLCGAALCGGASYAMLEKFFSEYDASNRGTKLPQYENMNRIAMEAYEKGVQPLTVDTTFCGTRGTPTLRGSISSIGITDFTPAGLILGVIYGMSNELYTMYCESGVKKEKIIASGGAVQKNIVLQYAIAEQFGVELIVSTQVEEASKGAALFSAVAAGLLPDIETFSDYIVYK